MNPMKNRERMIEVKILEYLLYSDLYCLNLFEYVCLIN